MEWLESLVLGVVQGITEFLPISSDGHLMVVQHLFGAIKGKMRSPEEDIFFIVMLHLGTLMAIVVHYRHAAIAGARGLLGSTEVPDEFRRDRIIRVGILAVVATLPLIPDKLFFLKYIEETFKDPIYAGIGFLITSAVLGVTHFLGDKGEGKGPFETTLLDALLIGVAQMFAPLPGVSRSGLTIVAALLLGFRKTWAVGFSLLIAVPAILGAATFELRHVSKSMLTQDRILQTLAATIVAGIVGYLAIVWLVRVVRSGRLWYFSVYLIVLGIGVIVGFSILGKKGDGPKTPAPDGTSRSVPARPLDRRIASRQFGPLDRGHGPGTRPTGTRPRLGLAGRGYWDGLDLG